VPRPQGAGRKKSSAKPVTVFNGNDNIDTVKGTINVVGETPARPQQTTTTQDKTKTPRQPIKRKAAATDDKSKLRPADDKTTSIKDEAYWRKTLLTHERNRGRHHELDIRSVEYI